MSMLHNFQISISNITKKQADLLTSMFACDDWKVSYYEKSKHFHLNITQSICQSPEDYLRDLSKDIWLALKSYHEIEATSTCLENLPYDEFLFNKEDYEELLPKKRKSK